MVERFRCSDTDAHFCKKKENLGVVDSIKNKFTLLMPVVQNLICKDLPLWITKEFMLHLNRIFQKPAQLILHSKEEQSFLRTVENLLKLIMNCGDYELQTILVEAIISTCELCHIEEVLVHNFGDTNDFTRMFLQVFSKQNYINDLNIFLTAVNDSFYCVHSVPHLKVTFEETVIPPIKVMNGDNTWMHLNYGFRTLSFGCPRDSLRIQPGSIDRSNSYEFVTVNFKDIINICLLINNNFKTVNSVGGIFVINLTGKCLCRFDSSKDIAFSIKKISLTVPDGSHLQLIKKEFIKLFGDRFEEANQIPIKNKNFYDKGNFPLNSSIHNSSYRVENKRRKEIDDSMNNQESVFLKTWKLKNSLTLENRENVLGGTKDFWLNSTESPFKKLVVIDNKEATNLQLPITRLASESITNKENKTADLNFKIGTSSSRNRLITEKDLSATVDCKKKNTIDDSENFCLTSPNTTNKFMNDTKTNSINKSLSTKKGKGRCTTKKNVSLLKSSDVDTIATLKNKDMPESSKISLVVATTKEITIPSTSLFGEDSTSTFLEENDSSLLRFLHEEINNISDLRRPSTTAVSSFIFGEDSSLTISEENDSSLLRSIHEEINNISYLRSPSTTASSSSIFGTNGSITILEKDKSSLLCFINEELGNITELRSPSTTASSSSIFGTNGSITILEKDKSSLLCFINEELGNITELRSPSRTAGSSSIFGTNGSITILEKDKSSLLCFINEELGNITELRSPSTTASSSSIFGTNGSITILEKDKSSLLCFINEELGNITELRSPSTTASSSSIFGTNGSITILEKDKSSLLCFINEELGNITELRSPSRTAGSSSIFGEDSSLAIVEKNKSSKVNTQEMVNKKKSIKIDHSYSLENTEEIGNLDVIYRKETMNDDLLTLDNEESEYYLFNPDFTSTQNEKFFENVELNFTVDDNESIANPNTGNKMNERIFKAPSLKEFSQKTATELYKEFGNLMLTVRRVNSAENANDLNGRCYQEFNQLNDNSEIQDIDCILSRSTINITNLQINSKNENTVELTKEGDKNTVVNFQLLNEKYVALCNELQESKNEVIKLYAELACKTQELEEQERIHKEFLESIQINSKPNKACRQKSDTPKRKRTEEQISSQSEISNGNVEKSFQEFITNEKIAKVIVQNEKVSNSEEFSEKRLSDKMAISNAEKRIKLAEDVRLSRKVQKPKEDKFNESRKSTRSGTAQNMQKSEVWNLEMMEAENRELDSSREFMSIWKAETKKLTDIQPIPKMHKSKKVNEDLNSV